MKKLPKKFLQLFFSTTILMLLFVGCDQTFEPIQENEKYFFSMFGYLDTSADTQWVRVVPVREQLNMPPEIPEMWVTLEYVESGETVVMKDSLFGRTSGFNYINFYTSMDIEPGQTYRVKAERSDGKSSFVILSTPDEFPTPLFLVDVEFPGANRNIYQIIIRGTFNIIDVQTWWFVRVKSGGEEVEKKFTFTYRDRLEWTNTYGGAYVAEFVYQDELEKIMDSSLIRTSPDADVEVLHRQVNVVDGGPEWNSEIPSLDDLVYAQPDVASNVQNGLGYVVGVNSKVIPYKTCKDSSGWITAC